MKDFFIGLLFLAALAAFIMAIVTAARAYELDQCRQEAVRAGHAEYYLDKEQIRRWRWKEAK